jgi:DNA-binding transcriptional LysR family regulator
MAEPRDRLRWDDLEIFCELAAHGSMRKAADATGQSLETIRRRINALEVALGERLFRRTPQGLQITASGREILNKAQEAHDAIAAIARKSGADRRRERRRLRVSLPEDIGATIYVPALAEGFGAGVLTLDIRLIDPALKPDWDGVDIGLSYAAPERGDLRRRKIGRVEFGFFRQRTPRSHESASARQASDGPLLLPPDSHPIFNGDSLEHLRRSNAAHTAWRVNSALALRDLIAETNAVGLLPHAGDHRGLERIVFDEDSEYSGGLDLWLGFHADVGADPVARALIDRLVALTAPRPRRALRDLPSLTAPAGFHED